MAEDLSRLAEHLLLQDVVDSLSEHIVVIDAGGIIVDVNEAWKRFGRENGAPEDYEAIGKNYLHACRPAGGAFHAGAAAAYEGIYGVLEGKLAKFSCEYPCDSPSERRWFLMTVTPLARSGRGAVISHANITERKRYEEHVAFLADHDLLTGLANRRAFYARATELLERAKRQHESLSLIYLDLDGFKRINDLLGHEAGDRLLQGVAARLRAQTRASDIVARFGGDEFVILLYDQDEDACHTVLECLGSALSAPYAVAGRELTVTGSFGVATLSDKSQDLDQLLSLADAAMYRVKGEGRLGVHQAAEQRVAEERAVEERAAA